MTTDPMEQPLAYICPNCTTGFHEAGQCPECLVERVAVEPGALGDPARRPLISPAGAIESHAPLWWLRVRLGRLAEAAERLRQGHSSNR